MSIVLTLKVVPNSKKSRIQKEPNGELKLYLQAPPVDGKANQELILFFSKKLKIPKNSITILSGLTSRIKRIAIETSLEQQQIYQQLGIEEQLSLI